MLTRPFLVKKPNGSFRLVTAFADVGRYSKPQPSLMPDVDSTLRQIAQWKYIIATDLTKSFYQIPLSSDSMKYCGVVTPFKGVRVYVRSAMGMPGSETALEELMCRVLGDLVEEGVVAKIADDLYCGGNTQLELLQNWTRVLQALQKNSLNLSATKNDYRTQNYNYSWMELAIRNYQSQPASYFYIISLSTTRQTCRYQVTVRHVAGAAILPSDFASRNAPDCEDSACQICTFVQFTENSVVRHISTKDILEGIQKLPFTSRNAWISIQTECSDLRRTHAHLRQGTRPSKKLTNVKDIKRYLNNACIAKDGLLVVKRNEPMAPTRECIVVPRQVLDGLLTSLHIKLDHPSTYQLKSVVHRYFFALDMDKAIETVSNGCHQCAALQKIPHKLNVQSTGDPPETIGSAFAADVMKRERQLILVVREYVTSYTAARLITDERQETLRESLLCLCVELCPLDGPFAVVRTDPAPGFQALVNDELLRRHRITIEVGRFKNKNKNPVADKAIQELEDEILRQDPNTRCISPLSLTLAIARLNSRIRNRGLSAREMWTQRDQFSNNQIPLTDQNLIQRQHELRKSNHSYSEISKAPSGALPETPHLEVGDLVYLYNDRNKTCARDRYLVVSTDNSWCNIRKFVGSQLRNTSYRVKRSDCYKVPSLLNTLRQQDTYSHDNSTSSDEDDNTVKTQSPPKPPDIPNVISIPHSQELEPELFENEPSDLSLPIGENELQHDPDDQVNTDVIRRSTRKRHPPKFLQDNYFLSQ
ncbi:Hypothetical predicted protein [Mytilus galloprovincialis]|uniref:Integrase catalytic domain-containing protein n=1 Tax=Mytilus galloprovincialis TaxID=29158 RepID=A0A8B6F9F9_MYTGA|nr:Hypothetical predicted protein [Mytilus galloprovincialis]